MLLDTDGLNNRKMRLDQLLLGYRALLNSPDTTEGQRDELLQGVLRHEAERANVIDIMLGITRLVATGYPGYEMETAPQAVIAAITELADNVVLAAKAFTPDEISGMTPLATPNP